MELTGIRHCPKFDDITRRIFRFGRKIDLNKLETALISLSKARRGSVALSERLFLEAVNETGIGDILEIGSNIGEHSRMFLERSNARLHCFEPNPRLFNTVVDLIDSGRIRFNPYGLSNESGLATFQIIEEMEGHESGSTHGMSSFEDVASGYNQHQHPVNVSMITAAKARAETYLDEARLNEARLALWIDVEGHAPAVLEGFGDKLSQADVVMCEVESIPDYTGTPTADVVIDMLEAAGMEIVYRDFQYYGRFNIVAMSPRAIERPRTGLADEVEVFIQHVRRAAKKEKREPKKERQQERQQQERQQEG